MGTLKNLIVVTDASLASEEAIAYALAMSKDLGASLTIILSYDPAMPNAKEKTRERFEHMEAHLLHNKPVHYHLATSDRPISQTLTEMPGIYHPDMLITNLLDESSLEELIENARHPVLVLPSKVFYQKIKNIALTYDAWMLPQEASFTFVSQLAKHYQAFVHILELDPTSSFSERYDLHSNREVDYLLKEVQHHFYFLREQDITAGVQKFMVRQEVDLLVVFSRIQLPADELPLERNTIKIARLLPKPLLICKE